MVATDTVQRSRDDALANLDLLRPVLRKLAESGDDLPNSLEIFFTPPFTDAAIDAFAGDYANLYVRSDLDFANILENMSRSNQPFPGPGGPLEDLPPTAELLGPLLGPTGLPPLPQFPLLGADPALPAPGAEGPPGTPAPARPPGVLGPLLGGGS